MSRKRAHRWVPPPPRRAPFVMPPPEEQCRWHDCKTERTVVGAEKFGRFGLCDYHIRITLDFFDQVEQSTIRIIEADETTDDHFLAPGQIYYALIDNTIKIGYTTDVSRRMRQYPPTARLLAVEPGTKKLERVRHSLFRVYLAHGREWFKPNPELDEWIEEVVRRNGEPPFEYYPFTRPDDKEPTVASKRFRHARAV